MKQLNICLGKLHVYAWCDEKCGECNWRFYCYTTSTRELQVRVTAHDIKKYGLITDIKKNNYAVTCANCGVVTAITMKQYEQLKIQCCACGKYNYISCEDESGILIGMRWTGNEGIV